MAQLSLRMDEEEKQLITNYAKFYNLSTSEFLRNVALERIENDIDCKLYQEAMAILEDKSDPIISFDELLNNLRFPKNE